MLSPVNYKGDICDIVLKSEGRISAACLNPRPPCTWETHVESKRITDRRAEETPEGEDRHFGRRHGHDDPGAAAGRGGVSRRTIPESPTRPAWKLRRPEPDPAGHRAGHSATVPRSRRRHHQDQHI